jgi:type I restriction-modification system DNA methylase subunit
MVGFKESPNNQNSAADTIKCAVANLSLPATSIEISRQEILRIMLNSGYSKSDLLLNSNFLGRNGKTYSADIIVLPSDAVLHIEPLLVIVVIKNDKCFNYNFLQDWESSGAKILGWFNGKNLKLFLLNSEEKYSEIPPILPKKSELEEPENIGVNLLKSSLVPCFDLKLTLAKLHDHLYGNSNIRIPSKIGIEIQKLLLIKMFDEELPNEKCEFYIAKNEMPQGLNGNGRISKEAYYSVGERIRDLLVKYNSSRNNSKEIDNLQLDNPSIYYAVLQLQSISLTKTPTDVLGDALEAFRAYTMKREGGQFFTHSYVVDLALKLAGFKGEANQNLADISCGTSGFLHGAKKIIVQSVKKQGYLTEEEQNRLISQLLLGVEVDGELVQISNTSPEFDKLPQNLVEQHDSLLPFENWNPSLASRLSQNSRYFMVGNPPFGTKITIKETTILESYVLAKAWKKSKHKWFPSNRIVPRSPDILFIERNLELLIPGLGKMVLVVPYQILSGPKEAFVREWIMTHCKILAIVDLPEDTFQPYTGTKGSLLVVQRRENPNPNWDRETDYQIFMACPQKIGHDRRGKPIFKTNSSGVIDTDLPEIGFAFNQFIEGKDPSKISKNAFTISSQSINRSSEIRLNAAYYHPASSDLRTKLFEICDKKSSLTITPLGELVDDIFCPGRFKREYTENVRDSVPFLGGSNITQLIPVTQKRILKNSSHYEDLALKSGWILITRSGTTGIVSTVPKDWEGYAASEHIIRIIPNPDKIHPGYLFGYLRSDIGQQLLKDGIFGSVIDEINSNYIASIPVLHPVDLSEAEKIGHGIYEADVLRAKASELIAKTSRAIEKVCGGYSSHPRNPVFGKNRVS